MITGFGDADLLAACDAPTADPSDAALVGGQVLDETESRMLAASPVAHFGAGMLGTDAGLAALAAWSRVVATRVDAFYVAFDMDALDASGGWALAMPEPAGISLETAVRAVRTIAAAGPVAGFGATAILIGRGGDPVRTADAVAALAEATLETPLTRGRPGRRAAATSARISPRRRGTRRRSRGTRPRSAPGRSPARMASPRDRRRGRDRSRAARARPHDPPNARVR